MKEKYQELIINLLLLMSIIFFIVAIVKNNIYPQIKCEKELSKIDNIDKTYDMLYYDENLRDEAKIVYTETLKRYNFIIDELKDNNIKILITNKNIKEKYKELTTIDNSKISDNVTGLFIKKLNLIIIKDIQCETEEIPLNDNIRNCLSEECKEKYKNSETISLKDFSNQTVIVDSFIKNLLEGMNISNNVQINDIVSLSKLNFFVEYDIQKNGSTLLHELGHFMNSISNYNLLKNDSFKRCYNNEKDKLFKDAPYFKSNISEYLAQCVSNFLIYNNVSWENNDKYETTQYIEKLVDEFK